MRREVRFAGPVETVPGRRSRLPVAAPWLGLVIAVACDAGLGGTHPKDGGTTQVGDASSDQGANPPTGQISIALADANVCPTLTVTAAPAATSVGRSISLHAWVTDPDGSPDDGPAARLTLQWSAASGQLSAPTSAQTEYACSAAGLQTVAITASDGRCTQEDNVKLRCLATDAAVEDAPDGADAGTGGTESVGSGGSGSGANSGGASGSGGATTGSGGASAMGSGGVASSGGVGAAGGSLSSGGRSGSSGGSPGGGGRPASGGGGGPGSLGAGGRGGGGASGNSGGTGGAPSGSGGGSASGGTPGQPPTKDEGDACNDCTTQNCNISTDGCDARGFQTPSDVPLCEALYACFRTQHCTSDADSDMLPDRDPSQWCWCGLGPNDDSTPCFVDSTKATGPCVADVIRAAKTAEAPTIRLRFVDPDYALGRAVNLANCRAAYCGGICR